jgi:hypothetical protein
MISRVDHVVLGFHIAGFAAGTAVVLAVFAEADIVLAAAEPTVLGAGAPPLDLVAKDADKILGHTAEISAIRRCGQSSKVLRPRVQEALSSESTGLQLTPAKREC